MKVSSLAVITVLPCALIAQDLAQPIDVLPASAATALVTSLEHSARHARHVWRDTAPLNADDTVNAYLEIARGDRRKWEFDMRANARKIDRMIPADIGGYPVNYGFVPQTISYDGDPFDALVLGPALRAGRVVAGRIIGVMFMEDEKGLDSKVVLSRADGNGRPLHKLTPAIEKEIGDYFRRYKQHEPGGFSKVPGWGSAEEGLQYVAITHAFFNQCRNATGAPCRVTR